ncbi:UNVERIFIED_CONTAM: hypothetical protein O8I53_05630 [Campylobacter lari]
MNKDDLLENKTNEENHECNSVENDILSEHIILDDAEEYSEEKTAKTPYKHVKKMVVEKKNTSYKYTKMSNFVLKLSRFYSLMPF